MSAVWFPVARRIHTCLPIRILRQAFEDAGSVCSCCFVSFVVVFFSWCKTDSLCDACSCSHVQIKRYRPCQKRSRLVFACNALGRGWWKVFPINQSDFQYLCCHLPSKASRHREWWKVFPINQSDFQYLCCHLPSKTSRHREWWNVFPINQSDFQYLCCHLPSKASRHREWWRVFPNKPVRLPISLLPLAK